MDAPLPPKFKMPQIKLYGGKGDPTEHLKTYRSWMELQGASGAAMCRAFSLTLIEAARRWYRKLRPGSISSFAQLSQILVNQFVGARDHQFPPTYFLLVKQGKDESLKDCITRFNKEVVRVENYSDAMALTTIMVGLQPGKFHYSLAKNPSRTFTELLSRAQKYSNVDELTNAKRGANSDSPRVAEKRKIKEEQIKNKEKTSRLEKKRSKDFAEQVSRVYTA